MASETYQAGDQVKVYSSGHNAGSEAGGQDAVIVRQMPDADDYEVEFAAEQPEGTSPFVTVERLQLVKRSKKRAASADSTSEPEAAPGESDPTA